MLVVLGLGVVTVLEGVAYAKRANACWFMRLTIEERPSCCDLMGKTRFTLPGGDCCKLLTLEEAEPTALTDATASIAPVASCVQLVDVSGAAPLTTESCVPARARAPPRWRTTDTIVLLI